MKQRSWYYTPKEWSRHVGWGTVPDERNWDLLSKEEQEAVLNGTPIQIELLRAINLTNFLSKRESKCCSILST